MMNQIKTNPRVSLGFAFFGAIILLTAPAQIANAKNSIEESLKRIKKSGTLVSAHVVNLRTGKEYLGLDDQKPLNPASSIKLFTAYTALKRLGLNYAFDTQFFVSPSLSTVTDDARSICVVGSGDPSFVMEDLYLVVHALKRKGLSRVLPAITLDTSAFDGELIPEDRTDQDSERAYNSPIAGLNFNYNTITVFVNAMTAGKPALITLDWPFPFIKIQGSVMTAKTTDVTWNKKSKENEETVILGGKIAETIDGGEWRKPFRINRPAHAFGTALSQMMKNQGIHVDGDLQIKEGSCGTKTEPAYVHRSKPLPFIVGLMNKYSNNFIADALVKTLDHEVNRRSGTAEGGLSYIRDQLREIGIETTKSGRKLVSGSGLTRDNFFSASDFTRLLKKVYENLTALPELFSSLPLAGIDGTLKKKYLKTDIVEKLRGKTGTLNGVQSLVGVYPHSNGDWIGVSIIVNGGQGIPERDLATWLGNPANFE